MHKNLIALSTFAFLAACNTTHAPSTDDFADLAGAKADAFSSRIKLVGSLAYGDSKDAAYHNPPRYVAFSFDGQSGDDVEVTVDSSDGDPTVWVLDGNYRRLAHRDEQDPGVNDLTLTLPGSGTFYVVVRDIDYKDATFTVSLQGKSSDAKLGERCGGFVAKPRKCATGLVCKYNRVPDLPGTCVAAAPSCTTVDDCNTAVENGSWSIAPSELDTCVQNHDFVYVCLGCQNGVCTFNSGF